LGCIIKNLSLELDFLPEVSAQESRRIQVDLPSKKFRQLLFNGKEPEAHTNLWLKLDQNIYVAFGSEVIPQHRSEQGKTANAVPLTEAGDLFLRYFDAETHGVGHLLFPCFPIIIQYLFTLIKILASLALFGKTSKEGVSNVRGVKLISGVWQ
jgi:hypothetical protein